jgi:hypothetical protein
MQLNLKARDWHNWVSALLIVPMLLVGLTTIFLAHKKALGLNEIDLTPAVAWLPGYGEKAMAYKDMEIRSSLRLGDGSRWIGTQTGLYRLAGGEAVAVQELAGTQVRSIVAAPWGLVVAARNGIWTQGPAGWHRVHRGDAWHAALDPDGSVAVTLKDEGLVASRDGKAWQADDDARLALAALPAEARTAERITLGKLMLDLHTGKAFLGKEAEWIWIDLLGFVWVFLGGTGLYLWWRAQTKRRDVARKQFETLHG